MREAITTCINSISAEGSGFKVKKTTIYIASSPETFEKERSEISAFIQRLNNCYYEKGLYFSLVTLEYIEHAISLGEKQDEKSKLLSESSIAFFLFGNEADEETLGDFNTALDMSKKSGWPKIALYFKSPPDGTGESADIKALKDRLIFETAFYYNVFENTDTLKLGLMMQIKQLKLPGMDIKLENSKVYQGNEALLSFEHAEIVSDYEDLQRLKTEHARLESSFYTAKSKYAENPDDADLFAQYREVAKLRNEANKKIVDIERQLYEIYDGMFEQTSKGALSKRQIESYQLIERGNLKAARQVLDFDEILSEARREKAIVEESGKRAQVNINELMQLKDVNAAMLDWEGVDACYREAARLEEVHDLPRKAALEYVWHLFDQTKYDKAVELGERLKLRFETHGYGAADEEMSLLYHRLGIVYWMTERICEAEKMYKAALVIRKARTDGDPYLIREAIGNTYINLGVLYKNSGKYAQALESYNSVLEISKDLAKLDPDRYNEYLVSIFNNLGVLFIEMANYEQAVENLTAAQKILKELTEKKNDQSLELALAVCSTNIGIAYTDLKRYGEAEEQFNAAAVLLSQLEEANPEAYEPRIAWNYKSLGRLYTKVKRYAQAEEKLNTAAGILKRCLSNCDAFDIDLAEVQYEMGVMLGETRRFAEAENVLNSAIRAFEKYKESNELYAEKMDKAIRLRDSINDERYYVNQDMINAGLTQAEINMARLLLNGESRSYITRHLHISATEYNMLEKSIRRKMNAVGGRDITIAAAAERFKLTSRETDMLRYLSRSAGNDVIATELHLSDATVRRHIRNLLSKLSICERQNVAEWLREYEA